MSVDISLLHNCWKSDSVRRKEDEGSCGGRTVIYARSINHPRYYWNSQVTTDVGIDEYGDNFDNAPHLLEGKASLDAKYIKDEHTCRSRFRQIIDGPVFNNFILVCIIASSIILATETPAVEPPKDTRRMMRVVDIFFTVSFTIEAVAKIAAHGLWNDGKGYFSDRFNWLDMIVVLEGWMSLMKLNSSGSSIKVLRVLRVMRPLRTIKRFPQLRILTNALVSSLDQLVDIIFLTVCMISLFGVIGVLLWNGRFTGRCAPLNITTGVVVEGYSYRAPWDDYEYLSDISESRPQLCNFQYEDEVKACGLLSELSAAGNTCDEKIAVCIDVGKTPMHNLANFDNLFNAMVLLFQVLTLEEWPELVQMTSEAHSKGVFVWYFLAIIFIGSFVVMQLLGAIILARLQLALREEPKDMVQYTDSSSDSDSDSTADSNSDREMPFFTTESHQSQGPSRLNLRAPREGRLGFKVIEAVDLKQLQEIHKEKSIWWKRLIQCICYEPCITTYGYKELVTNENSMLSKLVYFCIFVNIATMASDAYGIPSWYRLTIWIIDVIITLIFGIEMTMKILGMSLVTYVKENTFDMLITVVSLIELAMDEKINGGMWGGGMNAGVSVLRVFRVFRVMRMIRVGRRMKSMLKVLQMIQGVLGPTMNVCILLLLFMFIFSILGVQLFASKDYHNIEVDANRYNFQYFHEAFVSVFIILTGENWPTIMYNALANVEANIILSIYFVFWILIGNYFLLNLVLATLLSQTATVVHNKVQARILKKELGLEELQFAVLRRHAFKRWQRKVNRMKPTFWEHLSFRLQKRKYFLRWLIQIVEHGVDIRCRSRSRRQSLTNRVRSISWAGVSSLPSLTHQISRQVRRSSSSTLPTSKEYDEAFVARIESKLSVHTFTAAEMERFKFWCQRMTRNQSWRRLVTCAIILSTALMVCSDVIKEEEVLPLEVTLLLVYIADIAIKVAAYGWCSAEDGDTMAFFSDRWNWIDFWVVGGSFLYLCVYTANPKEDANIVSKGIFKIIRGLRPLRLLSRVKSSRMLIITLGASMSKITDIMILLVAFVFIGAIMGQQLFKGSFYSCTLEGEQAIEGSVADDETYPSASDLLRGDEAAEQSGFLNGCEGGTVNDIDLNYRVENADFHFDNIGYAMLSTFSIVMLENWPEVAARAMDAYAEPKHPARIYQRYRNYDQASIFYFVVLIVIGNFMFLQVFVAVLFEQFMYQRCYKNGQFVAPEKMHEIEYEKRLVIDVQPHVRGRLPDSQFSKWCRMILNTHMWDNIEVGAVALNLLVLMVTHANQPDGLTTAQEIIGHGTGAIFLIEAMLALSGYSIRGYFAERENTLNLCVTLVSIIDIVLALSLRQCKDSPFLKILRCFRVTRIVKIFAKVPSLRLLMVTMQRPIPTLLSLLLIAFLFVVTCANICVLVFGHLKGATFSFSTMWNSLVSLSYFLTGEAYTEAFAAGLDKRNYPRGIPPLIWVTIVIAFFGTFVVVTNLLILNMFVMVVVDSYELVSDDTAGLNQDEILAFRDAWERVDIEATGYLSFGKLKYLAAYLPPTVLFGHWEMEDDALNRKYNKRKKTRPTFKEMVFFVFELNIEHFKTAREKYLDKFPRHYEVSRRHVEDPHRGKFHFHKVLLAVNRLVQQRKGQSHASQMHKIRGGSQNRAVMENKAAFVLASTFRRYKATRRFQGTRFELLWTSKEARHVIIIKRYKSSRLVVLRKHFDERRIMIAFLTWRAGASHRSKKKLLGTIKEWRTRKSKKFKSDIRNGAALVRRESVRQASQKLLQFRESKLLGVEEEKDGDELNETQGDKYSDTVECQFLATKDSDCPLATRVVGSDGGKDAALVNNEATEDVQTFAVEENHTEENFMRKYPNVQPIITRSVLKQHLLDLQRRRLALVDKHSRNVASLDIVLQRTGNGAEQNYGNEIESLEVESSVNETRPPLRKSWSRSNPQSSGHSALDHAIEGEEPNEEPKIRELQPKSFDQISSAKGSTGFGSDIISSASLLAHLKSLQNSVRQVASEASDTRKNKSSVESKIFSNLDIGMDNAIDDTAFDHTNHYFGSPLLRPKRTTDGVVDLDGHLRSPDSVEKARRLKATALSLSLQRSLSTQAKEAKKNEILNLDEVVRNGQQASLTIPKEEFLERLKRKKKKKEKKRKKQPVAMAPPSRSPPSSLSHHLSPPPIPDLTGLTGIPQQLQGHGQLQRPNGERNGGC